MTNTTNTASLRDTIRAAFGAIHSDGSIFFTNGEQFLDAARAALAAPAQAAPPASVEQEAMQMLWNDQQQEEKEHYRNVARGAERIKRQIADIYFEALGSQHLREQDRKMVTRFARAIEAAHGITAAQKGGKHGTE